MARSKCDHPDCIAPPKWYGYQQCYFVCDSHSEWGQEIENKLMEELNKAQDEYEENSGTN